MVGLGCPRTSAGASSPGVAALGGVGFTVSIFIAGLAFPAPEAVNAAKVGILIASALAGLIGAMVLLATSKPADTS